ncbi:MAG: hypothetical protein A2W80_13735 [Candidatus Riflebacteria bacterium GWC2_50_8]|nr:MAG: hypothetical protein A2W80_13735 [Candidatus Riflebacteria bacterium GWC2_50_8]
MQKWFSLSEIKRLIGSLYSLMGLRKKADREAWQSRPRKAIGGGLEYHIFSLPQEIQHAMKIKTSNEKIQALESKPAGRLGSVEGAKLQIKEKAEKTVNKNLRLEGMLKADCLDDLAKRRMNAKLEIIKLWEEFEKSSTEGKTASQYLFCCAYNHGQIEVADSVKDVISTISQSSLMMWIKQARNEGIVRLAGKYGNRKKTGVFYANQQLNDFIVAMFKQYPHCCAKQVWRGICANMQRFEIESAPSLRTVARFMDDWKRDNMAEYELMKNPDKYRGKLMPAFGNASQGIDRYLQLWETDSTPTDVMLKDGRHTIIGVIDVASRRPKVFISKTSNSVAVGLLMRRAIIDWGVPDCVKTDNGTDYVSRHITELFKSLEIEQSLCPPFTPQAKPHIERFFGTFTREFLELVPGYIGHSVPDRVDIEQRKSFAERITRGKEKDVDALPELTAVELQRQCDEWIENVYLKTPHSGLNGKAPIDFIADWINSGKPVHRITDPMSIQALDYLLAEVPGNKGIRNITKNGIRVDTFNFIAPELAVHIGAQVRVKYDPFNAGYINVYWLDGEVLCVAQCPEITGVSRAELAQVATAKSKQLQSEQRKKHKSVMRSMKPKNVGKEILQHYKDMPGRYIGPENVIEYNSPALQQAADQVGAIEAMSEPLTVDEINASAHKVTPEQEKLMAEIIDLEERKKANAEREKEEKKARAARYEEMLAANFEGISEDDDKWRRYWETSAEGRTHIRMKNFDAEPWPIINAR